MQLFGDTIMIELKTAEAVKKIRWELRMSQADLAKAVNCTQTCISAYELGQRNPSFRILKRLEEFIKKNNLDIHFC